MRTAEGERELADLDKSRERTLVAVRRLDDASTNSKNGDDLLKRLSAVEDEPGLGPKQPTLKNLAAEISTVANVTQGLLKDVESLGSQVFDDAEGSIQIRLRKQDQIINSLVSQFLPDGRSKPLTRLGEQGRGLIALRDEAETVMSTGTGRHDPTVVSNFDVNTVFAENRFQKVEKFVDDFFTDDGIQSTLEARIVETVIDHMEGEISKRQEAVRAYIDEVNANVHEEIHWPVKTTRNRSQTLRHGYKSSRR